MSAVSELPQSMSDVSRLLVEKLGVKGHRLKDQVRKAGHRLPRQIRQHAEVLVEAESLAAHPKLARTLDGARCKQAAEALTAHLSAIDPTDRRRGYWLGVLGGMAFNLLVWLVLLICALAWLGYV
ncbi:MAG: hypothetical protein AAGF79_14145 [Pseudomonadota bacterium]